MFNPNTSFFAAIEISGKAFPTRNYSDKNVEIEHGSTYAIVFGSDIGKPANVEISIDGKDIGTWRLGDHARMRIERPANVRKLFTFYRLRTPEAIASGIDENNPMLGIVSLRFIPEKNDLYDPQPSVKGVTRGGTGLSGRSNQTFGRASSIKLDYSQSVEINLKLIEPVIANDIEPLVEMQRTISKQELLGLIQSEFGISREEAITVIVRLATKGVINFENLTTDSLNSVKEYFLGDLREII